MMFESQCAEYFCEFVVSEEMSIFYRINTAYHDSLVDMGGGGLITCEFVLN